MRIIIIKMLGSFMMKDFGEHKMRKMKVSFKLQNALHI